MVFFLEFFLGRTPLACSNLSTAHRFVCVSLILLVVVIAETPPNPYCTMSCFSLILCTTSYMIASLSASTIHIWFAIAVKCTLYEKNIIFAPRVMGRITRAHSGGKLITEHFFDNKLASANAPRTFVTHHRKFQCIGISYFALVMLLLLVKIEKSYAAI